MPNCADVKGRESVGLPLIMFLVALVAFAITYALVYPSTVIAKKLGAVDLPSERRVHKRATTRMGGIAIFGGIAITLAVTYALCAAHVLPQELALPRNVNVIGLFAGMIVMFAVGCIDDVFQIRALYKLFGQIVAAIIVAASGVMLSEIKLFAGPGLFDLGILAWPITVFWLVAFANIINLIDGLDGLAAGVCAITYGAFFVMSLMNGTWFAALVALVGVGSCLAFLRFNFHPAKLFMGDSGSLTLGFLLGIISLLGLMRVATLTSLAVPVIIAGIPVLDTFSAIVRRRREHISISVPDKGHIHHSLMKGGRDQRTVVLTIYAICAVFAVSGVVVAGSNDIVRIVVVILDLAVAAFLVWRLKLFGAVLAHVYNPADRKNGRTRPGNPEFDAVMPQRHPVPDEEEVEEQES